MSDLRTVPISRITTRNNLFLGGDRELVMMSGVIAALLIFVAQNLIVAIFGIIFWLFAIRSIIF